MAGVSERDVTSRVGLESAVHLRGSRARDRPTERKGRKKARRKRRSVRAGQGRICCDSGGPVAFEFCFGMQQDCRMEQDALTSTALNGSQDGHETELAPLPNQPPGKTAILVVKFLVDSVCLSQQRLNRQSTRSAICPLTHLCHFHSHRNRKDLFLSLRSCQTVILPGPDYLLVFCKFVFTKI